MALLATDFTTSRCNGVKLARMREASKEVDLKRPAMARAKGRCADFKYPTTRFLLMAKAQTVRLYRIVGMKVTVKATR